MADLQWAADLRWVVGLQSATGLPWAEDRQQALGLQQAAGLQWVVGLRQVTGLPWADDLPLPSSAPRAGRKRAAAPAMERGVRPGPPLVDSGVAVRVKRHLGEKTRQNKYRPANGQESLKVQAEE